MKANDMILDEFEFPQWVDSSGKKISAIAVRIEGSPGSDPWTETVTAGLGYFSVLCISAALLPIEGMQDGDYLIRGDDGHYSAEVGPLFVSRHKLLEVLPPSVA